MMIIGICGASGSGKTTLAKELATKITGRTVLINQDAYYLDHAHLPFDQRARINYDDPEVFEHDELLRDVKLLREGKPITRKAYDYAHHCRADVAGEMIEPAETIIIEGIHAFYDERLRDLMDFKVFIRVDPDVCLIRRVKRDITERGREIQGIYDQYLKTVKPMYEKYIRGYIDYADLIVAGNKKNARISDMLAFYVNAGRAESKEENEFI